ncbi:MAG: ABC transporter permease [Terriglobales bacterium]
MNRMLAIVERDMRKFFRSPALMMVAMVFPLVQLVVLGNAFGGKIRDARVAVVDYDRGPQAIKVRQAFDSVRANVGTFVAVYYDDERQAVLDVRDSKVEAALIIPPDFSRRVYEANRPRIALVVDNSDNFMSSALESKFAELVVALNQPEVESRLVGRIALDLVELYPYIEYTKYLLPGSIALAMFVSVMVGGGIVYIDDKARGVHEGYLVTPITKLELIFGFIAAGALKAMIAGAVLTVLGSLLAGVGGVFYPAKMVWLLAMIAATSFAFISMMFFFMARVQDPLVPRAMFGILNTLLFFPSGAIYPIHSFPWWLKGLAWIDPFTYSVHGFKALLLKDAGFLAIWGDLAYLIVFTGIMTTGAVLLFKRTL